MSYNYFDIAEFTCKCGCGENEIDLPFVSRLDAARGSACTPFVIVSGYRCPDHPIEAAKDDPGVHSWGVAADIAAPDSHTRFLILRSLIEHGFTRVGINFPGNTIHVDAAEGVPQAVAWGYD